MLLIVSMKPLQSTFTLMKRDVAEQRREGFQDLSEKLRFTSMRGETHPPLGQAMNINDVVSIRNIYIYRLITLCIYK